MCTRRVGPLVIERSELHGCLLETAGDLNLRPDPMILSHYGTRTLPSLARIHLLAILATAGLSSPTIGQTRPTIPTRDYGQFEALGRTILSPDGRWIAYSITRVDETTEIRVRRIAHDTTRVIPAASAPVFSADSRWLALSLGVSAQEQSRRRTTGLPDAQPGARLLDLSNGRERSFDDVQALRFDATGRFLVLHGAESPQANGRGAQLRILDLENGLEEVMANVGRFVWHDTLPLLAFTLKTDASGATSIRVYDARARRSITLETATATYPHIVWHKGAPDLVAMRASHHPAAAGRKNSLVSWRQVHRPTPPRIPLEDALLAHGDSLTVSEHYVPRWSADGAQIAFGLKPLKRDAESGRSEATEAMATLEVWHSSDVEIVPQQKAESFSQRSLLALWNPARQSVVRMGNARDDEVELLEGWQFALHRSATPYPFGTKFGRPYYDMRLVTTETGTQALALDSVRHGYSSGAGKYLLSFDGRDFWTYEIASGTRRNITRRLATIFADTNSDLPSDIMSPYGVGGWLDDDRAVLIYDEHDIWRISPDGLVAKRLTSGAEEHVVHRTVQLDERRRTFSPSNPIYLSLHGDHDQRRGYARIMPGGQVERLVFRAKRVSGLMKAAAAPVFAYREEGRDDSPDYFVGDETLANATQVTSTNPFLQRYAWTRAEILRFQNERGRELGGVLLYPAHFDSSRRHPMIVFAYETLSPQAYVFQSPDARVPYNFTTWTQHGYFVLLPDVYFRPRHPGVSLLETLRPVIDTVVRRGLVDRTRVGFAGHSWGGYHATYVATHSEIFAASVAGAPLTDLVSFMGQIHQSDGLPELTHWETAQPRMQVPYWEDPAAYHRNSPLYNVHNMKTPLLMAFGKNDGIIDWSQGIQFYNFARRAGKQMVLLAYDGEDHFLRKKPNQVDYHRRILEWFGHFLKGEPAPQWIQRGTTVDDIEAEVRRLAAP